MVFTMYTDPWDHAKYRRPTYHSHTNQHCHHQLAVTGDLAVNKMLMSTISVEAAGNRRYHSAELDGSACSLRFDRF